MIPKMSSSQINLYSLSEIAFGSPEAQLCFSARSAPCSRRAISSRVYLRKAQPLLAV